MDTESLSSSGDLKPAIEFGASTTDEVDFEAFGFVSIPPSPPKTSIPPSPPKTSFPRWNEERFEDGYDSDGEILLSKQGVFDIFDDEQSLPSREEGPETEETTSEAVGAHHRSTGGGASTTPHAGTSINNSSSTSAAAVAQNLSINGEVLTDILIDKMSVKDIRVELGRRKLRIKGNRPDIIPRLKQAVRDGVLPSLSSLNENQNIEEARSLRPFHRKL